MPVYKFRKSWLPFRQYNFTLYLIGINFFVFVLALINPEAIMTKLGMNPLWVTHAGTFWTPFTYMFLHVDVGHIVFNMLTLYFVGTDTENHLGSWAFLIFYLLAGLAGGLLSLATYLLGMPLEMQYQVLLLGASGAIYAVLMAYACLFPDRQLLVFGIFPVRAPWLVAGYAVIESVLELTGQVGGVAHMTHLYGLAFGYLVMLLVYRINFFSTLKRR